MTPGSTLDLSFNLYAIASLDGDGPNVAGGGNGGYFDIFAGATSIFHQAFANYGGGETQSYPIAGSAPGAGATSLNALGDTGYPASANIQDAEYTFSLTGITSASSSVTFTFINNSNQDMGDEFYGIDNLVVSASGGMSPVPLPASAPMFGAALLALGAVPYGLKRKKAAAA